MKKFVSMAMVAAMTTSMVPATAFAAEVDGTAKVVNSWTEKNSFSGKVDGTTVPELQVKLTEDQYQQTDDGLYVTELTVTLDNAEFADWDGDGFEDLVGIRAAGTNGTAGAIKYSYTEVEDEDRIVEMLEHVYDTKGNPTDTTLDEGLYYVLDSDITTANTNGTVIDKSRVDLSEWAGAVLSRQNVSAYGNYTAADINTHRPAGVTTNLEQAGAMFNEAVLGVSLEDARERVLVDYMKVVVGAPTQAKAEELAAAYTWNEAKAEWTCDAAIDPYKVLTEATVAAGATNEVALCSDEDGDSTVDTIVGIEGIDKDTWVDIAYKALNAVATSELKGVYEESIEYVKGTGDKRDFDIFVDVDSNSPEEMKIMIVSVDQLLEDDVIYIDLESKLDKIKDAYVAVESDDITISNEGEDLLYVDIEDEGIKASIKKLANVAEEEKAYLEKNLKLESVVGDFADGQEIELKLSNGFEFAFVEEAAQLTYTLDKKDDDTVIVTVDGPTDVVEINAKHLQIEAVSAKSGAVATIKAKAKHNVTDGFQATASVEVAKVVDYTVTMSVDADKDVPVIYSGVNVANYGITDDSDHMSLEVTIEESFPGAWSTRKGFNFELPDGVYVTNVELKDHDALLINKKEATDVQIMDAFEKAYQDGDHKNFEFGKRVFDDVNHDLEDDCATLSFELELVADPTFAGDVNLKLTGDLVDEQEVTIAKFQPIAVVKAEQNDMKIDYRYTAIPTAITVTETAAGLWAEESELWVAIEKGDYIEFEDDATFETTNGLEISDFTETRQDKANGDADVAAVGFEVDDESDEAATVTVTNMELFMQRSIPAGPYDLIAGGSAFEEYHKEVLFAPDTHTTAAAHGTAKCKDECIVDDVCDYSNVVKEAFVNVVTAGREQDDASFTTKVVVPVGESYIVAGEAQVNLDVPAYVSAAGYTMLPVRAVATALGINNNNVIWNGETKTVTILYGQRIITMVAGQKTVNVNGSVIPASAAVEIVDGRTFLPMRDLATALGVTDITWDAATKTATLNGNV